MSAKVACSCGWARVYPTVAKAQFNAGRHICKVDDAVRRATRRHRCARCGLEAVYENAGAAEARHWFGKHSCRKRELALLRSTQAQQREALIDRTPKPCHHKIAEHQHGTNAAYILDRCRCLPCAKAHSDQESWRVRQKAYGRYQRYVAAGPVREHVESLTTAGIGLKQLAKVSGVAHGALWKLMYGKTQPDGSRTPSRRVQRETAEKLYAIDPDWTEGQLPLAAGARDVDGTPLARLHLRALVALGWSMSSLGRRLGIKYAGNAVLLFTGDRTMQRRTVDQVAALYAELSMTLPPETNQRERISATRARGYAKAHGWLPPLDLEIDEADAADGEDLDEVAIARRMDGDRSIVLTTPEAIELVRIWRASGRPLNECARITGLKPERYYSPPNRQEAS